MFLIFAISIREFLEAFLIIGIFLGISKELSLKREKEIIGATGIGVMIALLVSLGMFFLGSTIRGWLVEKNIDILEGLFLVGSGLCIPYIAISLHQFFQEGRNTMLKKAKKQLSVTFDLSLFLTLIFFMVREGCEIALFTSTTTLTSVFLQNSIGLLGGFLVSFLLSIVTYRTFIRLPIKKIFNVTEMGIIIFGATMTMNGVTTLFNWLFHFHIETIISLPLAFIPSETTLLGHLLKNVLGIQQHLSLVQILIMGIYIGTVLLVLQKHTNMYTHT